MGPQSSDLTRKSTLLNQLFGTNFKQMDAKKGKSQTTKGIWIAKPVGIEPCTLVMDIEGTDGRERGQDDTTFERQSTLFALAVSDIVMMNMWYNDYGRDGAACRPLLKIVFEVMLKLFGRSNGLDARARRTLMFVIRDINEEIPLEILREDIQKDIEKIWDDIIKPEAHRGTPLTDFFAVDVVALPHFQYLKEQFKEEVERLKKRFDKSTAPGGLAGDRRGVVPASAFFVSLKDIWKKIKENKDIDLPSHKVMVANVRCGEIVEEQLTSFTKSQEWQRLKASRLQYNTFGKRLASSIDSCLQEYDVKTTYFDQGVRISKRGELKDKLWKEILRPTIREMLGNIRDTILRKFEEELDRRLKGKPFSMTVHAVKEDFIAQFNSEAAKVCVDEKFVEACEEISEARQGLGSDIDKQAVGFRNSKLSDLPTKYEGKLYNALYVDVAAIFDAPCDNMWKNIRDLLEDLTQKFISEFDGEISYLEVDEEKKNEIISRLKAVGRKVVVRRAQAAARRVLEHMTKRFSEKFHFHPDSPMLPRQWGFTDHIGTITKDADSACLKILSHFAAVRLDQNFDSIERTLLDSLLDSRKQTSVSTGTAAATMDASVVSLDSGTTSTSTGIITATDSLDSRYWSEVPESETLLTPIQCRDKWNEFKEETQRVVNNSKKAKLKTIAGRAGNAISGAFKFIPGMPDITDIPGVGEAFEKISEYFQEKEG